MASPLEQGATTPEKIETPAKNAGAEVSPVQTFTTKDWQTAKVDVNGDKTSSLPAVAIDKASPGAALVSDQATIEDKLRAVEALGRAGQTSIEIVDKDGSKRSLTIELEKAGARTLVHLFATDDQGKERVVLRGVKNTDGTYQQQQTESGVAVSSYGSWWSKNMGDRTFFAEVKQASAKPAHSSEPDLFPARRNDIPASKPDTNTASAAQIDANQFPARRSEVAPAVVTEVPRPVLSEQNSIVDTTAQRQREVAQAEQAEQTAARAREVTLPWANRPVVKPVSDAQRLNQLFDGVAEKAGYSRQITQVDDGTVYFRAGMAIDADGSPRATQIDPTGQSRTSLRYKGGASVNAEQTNYFVLPLERYQQYGVRLGDIAAVRYGDQVRFAVFADVGPRQKLGEGSMALAASLGVNPNPRTGGTHKPVVEYIVFPGSGNGRPLHNGAHEDLGRHYLGKAYRKNR